LFNEVLGAVFWLITENDKTSKIPTANGSCPKGHTAPSPSSKAFIKKLAHSWKRPWNYGN
jgi:hypothetical protein